MVRKRFIFKHVLKDFCNLAIFRIPKKISLPNDLEINEAIGKFSVEENEKITQKIKELEMNIKQVSFMPI